MAQGYSKDVLKGVQWVFKDVLRLSQGCFNVSKVWCGCGGAISRDVFKVVKPCFSLPEGDKKVMNYF